MQKHRTIYLENLFPDFEPLSGDRLFKEDPALICGFGTFNEKSVVSENRLTVIPKDFDLRVAALFGCAVTSGFGAVNNDAKVKIC